MRTLLTAIKKTIFWSYERGTWQYDVLCVLILAFIFATPNRWFEGPPSRLSKALQGPIYVGREEIDLDRDARLEDRISARLTQKLGHPVNVTKVEEMFDTSGNLKGYIVREK